MSNLNFIANIPQSATRRILIRVCFVSFIAVVLLTIFGHQKIKEFVTTAANTSSLAIVSSPASPSATIASNAQEKLSGIKASVSPTPAITYKPGQPSAVSQYSGGLNASDRKSNWYLYARSEQEVKWLDFYGFPTPAEDERLKNITDAELKVLVDAGDLNAKAHQAARLAKSLFENKDVFNAPVAQGTMGYLLMEGGPYQAITVLNAYSDMLRDFAYLPAEQRTEQQRKILEIYGMCADDALAKGMMYGDYATEVAYNRSSIAVKGDLGLSAKPLSAASFANGLASGSKERIGKGLPPITIIPRPEPPSRDILNFSDGTIVWERH